MIRSRLPCFAAVPSPPSLSATQAVAAATALTATALTLRSLVKMSSWYFSIRSYPSNYPPPGPPPIPFLGNVLSLRKAYYKTLFAHVRHPVAVFWVLSTPFLVVNDEDGLRRVLGGSKGLYAKPRYFGYRSKTVHKAVQDTNKIVAEESREYSKHEDASRRALDTMVSDSLANIRYAMLSLLDELVLLSNQHEKPKIDVLHVVRSQVVALNLLILFGLSCGNGGENAASISSMVGYAGMEFARRMVNPLKIFIDLFANVRFARDVTGLIGLGRRLCSRLDETAEALQGNAVPGNEVTGDRGGGAGLSWVHAWVGKVGRIGKLGKVVGLFMASTQTVPLTAVWMMELVGRDPAIRERVKEELDKLGVREYRDVTVRALEEMEFVDAVVKETLRLYPPFPLIQREAQADDVLCGVRVPKGALVYVVPWLVHRNSKYWADPHKFKPERFMGSARHGDAPSDWVYLPFGRGPRMCAGSRLALTELKVLLCCAVMGYEWKSGGDIVIFPELGMVPNSVKLSMTKKSKNEKAFS